MDELDGSITSVGFASGDRFVIGWWETSPIGAFADVMWADPHAGRRLIAAPDPAEYITSIYPFPEVVDAAPVITAMGRRIEVRAGPLTLDLTTSRLVIPFPPRPRVVTATVENALARLLLGVRTYGVSPTGAREWYRTRRVRTVVAARGRLDGRDLGALAPVARPVGFGFTDPPRHPTSVRTRVSVARADA